MTGPVIAGVDGGPCATDALVLGQWIAETLERAGLQCVRLGNAHRTTSST